MDIVTCIETYGFAVLFIAVGIIAFIGLLKICGVFKCLTGKKVLKTAVYYSLDIVLSFGVAALYFKLADKDFAQYLTYCAAQVAVTTTLYAVYENFGLRALIQKIVASIQTAIKNSKNEQLVRFVQQMGIDNVLQEIQKLVTQTDSDKQSK